MGVAVAKQVIMQAFHDLVWGGYDVNLIPVYENHLAPGCYLFPGYVRVQTTDFAWIQAPE